MKSDDPEIEDLVAPKVDEPGLLAPKASAEITDLPTPKYIPDLLAPKSKSAAEISDLPAPKRDSPGMLAPRADLPAPKGYFDDLPQPAIGGQGLPAPKGYFEDLPQRARTGPGLPAPKGFFDDIPQPAKPHPEPPAPKGYFENVPQPAKPRAESSPPFKSPSKPPSTHMVHKGLGDNLPAPAKRAEVQVPKYEDHKYEAPASTIPLPPPRSGEVTFAPPVTPAAPPPERQRPRSVERQDDPPRRTPPRRTGPRKPERPSVSPLLIVALVLAAAVAIYLLRPTARHRADAVESVDAG